MKVEKGKEILDILKATDHLCTIDYVHNQATGLTRAQVAYMLKQLHNLGVIERESILTGKSKPQLAYRYARQ